MELRLLVWYKPDNKKGNHLKVPEPFYHSSTLPGHQNSIREQNQEELLANVEPKVAGSSLEGDIALLQLR